MGEARTDSRPWWGLAAIVLASTIAYLPGVLGVGLLSDDHQLASIAAGKASVLSPLERHHYTLPLQVLFAAVAHGSIAPRAWHLLALAGHEIAVVLVHALATRGLRLGRFAALLATGLFAASPAGSEAVIWLAATGYVFVAPLILAGLVLALAPVERASPWRVGLALAALQAAALLAHDTGVLLLPLVAAMSLAGEPRRFPAKMAVLAPGAVAWAGALVVKRASGWVVAAYGKTNGLGYAARSLAVGPLTVLYPQGEKPFYASPAGIALALGVLALLAVGAWRSRAVRAALAGYLVAALPSALFATPQSRYVYLPGAFVALALAASLVELLPAGRARRLVAAALVAASLGWTVQRGAWFRGAFDASVEVAAMIEGLPDTHGRPLVVVDLPDRYGPGRTIFRPYVWRNGSTVAIHRAFTPVNVPGASFIWEEAEAIPLLPRSAVRARFPDAAIYEVTGDGRSFRVVPFAE